MTQNNDTEKAPPVAVMQLEALSGTGEIAIPGFETVLLDQSPQGTAIEIPGEIELYDNTTLRVGRDRNNDLVLKIPNVSRFHALFAASASGVILSDLSSTNGTIVNGTPIQSPVDLQSGDIVDIGFAKFKIKCPLGGSAVPAHKHCLSGNCQGSVRELWIAS